MSKRAFRTRPPRRMGGGGGRSSIVCLKAHHHTWAENSPCLPDGDGGSSVARKMQKPFAVASKTAGTATRHAAAALRRHAGNRLVLIGGKKYAAKCPASRSSCWPATTRRTAQSARCRRHFFSSCRTRSCRLAVKLAFRLDPLTIGWALSRGRCRPGLSTGESELAAGRGSPICRGERHTICPYQLLLAGRQRQRFEGRAGERALSVSRIA